jgi:hypothetical protein
MTSLSFLTLECSRISTEGLHDLIFRLYFIVVMANREFGDLDDSGEASTLFYCKTSLLECNSVICLEWQEICEWVLPIFELVRYIVEIIDWHMSNPSFLKLTLMSWQFGFHWVSMMFDLIKVGNCWYCSVEYFWKNQQVWIWEWQDRLLIWSEWESQDWGRKWFAEVVDYWYGINNCESASILSLAGDLLVRSLTSHRVNKCPCSEYSLANWETVKDW